jgi:hypothetical protein
MFAVGKEHGKTAAANAVQKHFDGLAKGMPARAGARKVARSIWRNSPAIQQETGPYSDTGYNDWECGFVRGYQAYLDNKEWKQ